MADQGKHTLFDKDTFELFVQPGEVVEVRGIGMYGNPKFRRGKGAA